MSPVINVKRGIGLIWGIDAILLCEFSTSAVQQKELNQNFKNLQQSCGIEYATDVYGNFLTWSNVTPKTMLFVLQLQV